MSKNGPLWQERWFIIAASFGGPMLLMLFAMAVGWVHALEVRLLDLRYRSLPVSESISDRVVVILTESDDPEVYRELLAKIVARQPAGVLVDRFFEEDQLPALPVHPRILSQSVAAARPDESVLSDDQMETIRSFLITGLEAAADEPAEEETDSVLLWKIDRLQRGSLSVSLDPTEDYSTPGIRVPGTIITGVSEEMDRELPAAPLHCNAVEEAPSSIVRSVPAFCSFEGLMFPTLALRGLYMQGSALSSRLEAEELLIEWTDRQLRIPTENDRLYVHYYAGVDRRGAQPISRSMLPDGIIIKDRFIIIGPGHSTVQTPLGEMARTHVHATLLSNLMQRRFLERLSSSSGVGFAAIVCVLVSLTGTARRIRKSVFLPGFVILFVVGLAFVLFRMNIQLYTAPVIVAGILSWITVATFKTIVDGSRKRPARRALRRRVNRNLQRLILKDIAVLMHPREYDAAIVHIRIANWPESEERGILRRRRRLRRAVRQRILAGAGTIVREGTDKAGYEFAVVVGAPIPQAFPVLAFLPVLFDVRDLIAKTRMRPGFGSISLRAALHRAEATVGFFDGTLQEPMDARGPEVDFARSLLEIADVFAVEILATEACATLLSHPHFTRQLDRIASSVDERPLRIYEVIGQRADVPPDVVDDVHAYEDALAMYQRHDWDGAKARLESLGSIGGKKDRATAILLERIPKLKRRKIPEDWDGVFRV